MTPTWAVIDDGFGCGMIIIDPDSMMILQCPPPYFESLTGRELRSLPKRFKIEWKISGRLTKSEMIAYRFKLTETIE